MISLLIGFPQLRDELEFGGKSKASPVEGEVAKIY